MTDQTQKIHNPDPDEIRRLCAEIRAGWGAAMEERRTRVDQRAVPAKLPTIAAGLDLTYEQRRSEELDF